MWRYFSQLGPARMLVQSSEHALPKQREQNVAKKDVHQLAIQNQAAKSSKSGPILAALTRFSFHCTSNPGFKFLLHCTANETDSGVELPVMTAMVIA
jgi:hypothetical protein